MDWAPQIAYAVGLIATDGNLSPDGRHIEFTSKDLELVEQFKRCLSLKNRIGTKGRGSGTQRYFRIQFGGKHWYQWLRSLGLSPQKSLTIGALSIPTHVFADFLRGHFDGDGSLSVYWDSIFPRSRRCYLRFYSASRSHLDWLRARITQLWELKGYQTHSAGRVFRLNYAKQESLVLLKRLYYADDLPCLKRKRQIAEEVLAMYAEVAKLANAQVSEACAERLEGSTPSLRIESFT